MDHQQQKDLLPEKRITSLLRLLSAVEIKNLEQFSQCDAVCDDLRTRILLAEFIKPIRSVRKNKGDSPEKGDPGWDDVSVKLPDRKTLYIRVFNATNYEAKQERLMAQFRAVHELIERFVAWVQLQADKPKIHQYVCEYVARTDNEEVFEHQWSKWEKSLEDAPKGHHTFYQNLMLHLTNESHWAFDRQEVPAEGFFRAQAAYVDFLHQAASCSTRSNQGFQNPADRPGKHALSSEQEIKTPFLNDLYRELSALAADKNTPEPAWLDFVQKYYVHFNLMDQGQRETMFRIIANGYIARFNGSEHVFAQHLGDLYDWVSRQNGLSKIWILSPADYLNGALAFGLSGHLEKMAQFIKDQSPRLPASLKQSTQALAEAYHAYYSKELALAEQKIEKVQQRRLFLGLRKHSLRLRVVYDTLPHEDIDKMGKELETYRAYFYDKKDKLKPERLAAYLRLATFVQKLATIYEQKKMYRQAIPKKEEVLEELNDSKEVKPIAYGWIKKKVDALYEK